ncbi:hypothetical protein MMC21_002829 [Puttea exsequens]|nr:hypothetical protein [Puttea exsequens]
MGLTSTSIFFKAFILLAVFITFLSYVLWSHLGSATNALASQKPNLPPFQFDHPSAKNWTRRVWQTSKQDVTELANEDREHVKTWANLNPGYRHEVLTDEMMDSYVVEHFHKSHPDIEDLYFDVQDYILRSDLIRYFILLADGGIYNDLDVGCVKPIDLWVPKQYNNSAGVVLGVEVDNNFGPDGRTFTGGEDLFQLVNWTIMSKPNQPFMRFLVDRVIENIKKLAASQKKPVSKMAYTIQDVLDSTGPAAVTKAFFDYATDITGHNVTYRNFTKIEEPKLVGEVVIMPIHAFGAGHQVEWAGMKTKAEAVLVHHYFAGTWKEGFLNDPSHALGGNEGETETEEQGQNDQQSKIESDGNSTKATAAKQDPR